MGEIQERVSRQQQTTDWLDGSHPELVRLRDKLACGTHDRALRGALLLLELTEPESITVARSYAFPAGRGPQPADMALQEAWELFRHDRYRSLN